LLDFARYGYRSQHAISWIMTIRKGFEAFLYANVGGNFMIKIRNTLVASMFGLLAAGGFSTGAEAKTTMCGPNWPAQRKNVVKFVNDKFPAKCTFDGSNSDVLSLTKTRNKVTAVVDGLDKSGKRLVKTFVYDIVSLGDKAGYAVCFNEGVQGLRGVIGGPCKDRK